MPLYIYQKKNLLQQKFNKTYFYFKTKIYSNLKKKHPICIYHSHKTGDGCHRPKSEFHSCITTQLCHGDMHCMVPQLGVSEVRNLLVDRFNNGNERPLACVKCHEAFVIRWQVGIPFIS